MPDPDYYKVKVSEPISAFNVVFIPGREYQVSAAIYNDGEIAPGVSFKSKCVNAQPLLPPPE